MSESLMIEDDDWGCAGDVFTLHIDRRLDGALTVRLSEAVAESHRIMARRLEYTMTARQADSLTKWLTQGVNL